jgi:hypothetical protein
MRSTMAALSQFNDQQPCAVRDRQDRTPEEQCLTMTERKDILAWRYSSVLALVMPSVRPSAAPFTRRLRKQKAGT